MTYLRKEVYTVLWALLSLFLIVAVVTPFLLRKLMPSADELHFIAPGNQPFYIGVPGTYTIVYEDEEVAVDQFERTGKGNVSALNVEVNSLEDGQMLKLFPPPQKRKYSAGGLKGISIYQFNAVKLGDYTLLTYYKDNKKDEVILGVNRNTTPGELPQKIAMILVICVSATLGMLALIWAFRNTKLS